ncbi:hypothetical protein F4801DRAFT_281668 [Xylaria longipes]|nr:hypothetical protein F4801DRAFT_281668 [Xylaria longipes]RYC58236.1 hypothetical protein CHU98_g7985 [Xylaria longipes]
MEIYGRPLSEELVTKLTRFPEVELWGMLKRYHDVEPRKPCRNPVRSSLGPVGILPLELLFDVLEFLDFRSLMRLMRVSLQWKVAVEALPAYAALTKHAREELNTLGLTGIIKHHTTSALYGALLSQKCASCFEFGGFLFLPTCERICFACLMHNQAYWMLSVWQARECFSLTDEELCTLPVLQAIPGSYFVGSQQTQRWSIPLVSVKQTKQLANEVHGSARMTAIKYVESKPFARSTVYQRFHNASLDPPGCDLSRVRLKALPEDDDYCGMAAIRFPYVRSGQADVGRLCRGCEYVSRNFDSLPDAIKAKVVPPGVDKRIPLRAMSTRLRSSRGFIQHLSGCYGVERLLAERNV